MRIDTGYNILVKKLIETNHGLVTIYQPRVVEPVRKHYFGVTSMDTTTLFVHLLMLLILVICACGVYGVLLCRLFVRTPQDNSEQNPEIILTPFTNNEDNSTADGLQFTFPCAAAV